MPVRTTYKFPLDLLGTNPANKILGEKHTIGSQRGRIFIADSGPFFGTSLVVRDMTTGKTLKPVEDYLLIHSYREAMEATAQAVYSGVRIVNRDVGTNIEIDVHYVGGEFSYSTFALFDMIQLLLDDDRPIEWGELIGVPNEWAPTPHLHSAYDLYAMKHLVAATADIADAIRDGYNAAHTLLFQMLDARISTFEQVIPKLTKCYLDATVELSTLL